MTDDIWDEKPKAVEVAEEYADNYYHASDMDAWLEKVKTHYVPIKEKADAMLRFRKAAEDLGEYAADLNDKLDAVKKVYQNILDYYEDDCGVHPMYPLKETREDLWKILEAEP